MAPSLDGLSPEQKRALLLKMMKEPPASGLAVWQQGVTAYHQIVEPNVSNHNICCTLRHFRRSDPEMLRTRLQRIVDRHAILRTSYKLVGEDKIYQHVQPQHTVAFTTRDARGWSADVLHQRMIEDARQVFDVIHLPVFRAWLYQREHDELLVLSMHHAASDLWSVEIMLAELDTPPEGPPPAPFLAYATEHFAWLTSAAGKATAEWWQRIVAGAVSPRFGKTFFQTPADHVHFRIERELYERIRQTTQQHKVTLFNFLISAVQTLVHENRHQDDVSIVCPVANRDYPRFVATCGFFATTLIYRQQFPAGMTWRELWQRNRAYIQETLDHQSYPVQRAAPDMEFLFMFQKYQQTRWQAPPENVAPLPIFSLGFTASPTFGLREFLRLEIPAAPFPVTLEVIDLGFAISGTLRYRRTVFPDPDREGPQLVARLKELLEQAASHPEAPL